MPNPQPLTKQQRYSARMRDLGRVQVMVWATPKEKRLLHAYLKELRK